MKNIVFIGAGNVATHLALELQKHAYDIVQVYSLTEDSARILAEKVNASYTTNIEEVISDADLYVFSVKDSVLAGLIAQLPPNDGLWIHTAGSMGMDIFKEYVNKYGVLYPFQTFTKGRNINWREVPLFIEGSDRESVTMLQRIAGRLSDKVMELTSDRRRYVHLTGVFACNFTNHMYALSEMILKKAELPFDIALPLIGETCAKVHELSPIEAQTGPAVRYDENVMNKHLALIDNDRVRHIYRLISKSIHEIQNSKK